MKRTFVTLLSTDSYLTGVLVLNKSLKQTKTRFPLLVLLSAGVSEKAEKTLQDYKIETLRLTKKVSPALENHNNQHENWSFTFDKLLIFNLLQFEKIVFIDSDMLILQNIDELFEKPNFSAVSAGSQLPQNAAWKNNLNSGLMVIEPNTKVFDKMISLIPSVTKKLQNVGDQDIIKEFVRGKWNKDLQLDDRYNMFQIYIDFYIKHLDYTIQYNTIQSDKSIKIIHYIGFPKPWLRELGLFDLCLLKMKIIFDKIIGKINYKRIANYLYYRQMQEFNHLKQQ